MLTPDKVLKIIASLVINISFYYPVSQVSNYVAD